MLSNLVKQKQLTLELSSDEDIFEYFINDMIKPLQERVEQILNSNDPTQKSTYIEDMWKYIESKYKTIQLKFKTSIANSKLAPEAIEQFLKGGPELKSETELKLRVASVTKKKQKKHTKAKNTDSKNIYACVTVCVV